MTLHELVTEYITAREPSGFLLDPAQALHYGVAAVQFYLGYGDLEDESATDLASITEDTELTPGEWSIIFPLFDLYVEKQAALILESSRVQGVDVFGRNTSEIQADIDKTEDEMQKMAYAQDCWTVGIPDSCPPP